MHIRYIIGLLLLLRQTVLYAQCASEQYYTIGNDTWVTAKVMEDIRGGCTYSFWRSTIDTVSTQTSNNWDIWILKNDSCGKRIWKKNFGYLLDSEDEFVDVIWTPDSNLLVLGGGFYMNQGGIYSGTLFKITPDGEVLWKRAYGGSNGLVPMSVAYNPYRKTYIISGRIERIHPSGLWNRAYVFEVDSVGNPLQEKDVFLNGDTVQADKQTLRIEKVGVFNDSTIWGILKNDEINNNYLIKLNKSLDSIDSIGLVHLVLPGFSYTNIGGDIYGSAHSNEIVLVMGGMEDSTHLSKSLLTFLDNNGNAIKRFTIQPNGDEDTRLWSGVFAICSDSSFVFGGDLYKYTSNLQMEWVRRFNNESVQNVIQLRSGAFAGIGISNRNSLKGYVEVFTMQTGTDGRFVGVEPSKAPLPSINLFPNPSTGIFTLEGLSLTKITATVWDATGKLVYTGELQNTILDLSNQPQGLYVAHFTDQSGKVVAVKKLSVLR